MNRLILVGNGFDLAHGMKTSYNDFILWYLKKRIKKALDGNYEDGLLKIAPLSNPDSLYLSKASFEFGNKVNVSEIIDLLYENDWLKSFLAKEKVLNLRTNLKVEFKSNLLRKLMINCGESNWVEIENEYYYALKDILKRDESKRKNHIEELNNEFAILIEELKQYLNTIQNTQDDLLIPEFDQIISNKINFDEIPLATNRKEGDKEYPKDVLVLNFNYTSTIDKNTFAESDDPLKVNYIHGNLNDDKNPIIFGFGDEYDDSYKLIEQERTKGFFKFIKSFGYFQNSNYQDLIRYIESDDFQVYVLGHSCGLSDRTMLKMIFEHEFCKSIKIYYHQKEEGTDNYTEITEEISRHFEDKGLMRKKIVPKDKSKPMPQTKK